MHDRRSTPNEAWLSSGHQNSEHFSYQKNVVSLTSEAIGEIGIRDGVPGLLIIVSSDCIHGRQGTVGPVLHVYQLRLFRPIFKTTLRSAAGHSNVRRLQICGVCRGKYSNYTNLYNLASLQVSVEWLSARCSTLNNRRGDP